MIGLARVRAHRHGPAAPRLTTLAFPLWLERRLHKGLQGFCVDTDSCDALLMSFESTKPRYGNSQILQRLVELGGFEPPTSSLRTKCSLN